MRVADTGAYIYHYGYVRDPVKMRHKVNYQRLFTFKDPAVMETPMDYAHQHGLLKPFTGTHPQIMQARIQRIQWDFKPIAKYNKPTIKDRFKKWMQRWTGWYIGYKNHKLIRTCREHSNP